MISNAESALLGLLCEGPMYPYQMSKEVQERSMDEWTDLSTSSIYKLLRKLEKDELLTGKVEISRGNRTRKIYKITEMGRETLWMKVKSLLQKPQDCKWQMDIAISNLAVVGKDEVLISLKNYRASLLQKIECYKALEKYLVETGCPGYRLGLATRPFHILNGELKWLEKYMKHIEITEEL